MEKHLRSIEGALKELSKTMESINRNMKRYFDNLAAINIELANRQPSSLFDEDRVLAQVCDMTEEEE